MKRLLFTIIAIIGFQFSFSQEIEQRLKEDIIEIIDGKFYFKDNVLLINAGDNYQLKFNFEASTDFISRDNFVYISVSIVDEIYAGYGSDVEIEDLEEIIGKPDRTINVYMTKKGVQIEEVDSDGKSQRTTKKWNEVL